MSENQIMNLKEDKKGTLLYQFINLDYNKWSLPLEVISDFSWNQQKLLNNDQELGTVHFFLSLCPVVPKARDTKQGNGRQHFHLIYCNPFSCCSVPRLYFRLPAWHHWRRAAGTSGEGRIAWMCCRGQMDRDGSCLPFTLFHSLSLSVVCLHKNVL